MNWEGRSPSQNTEKNSYKDLVKYSSEACFLSHGVCGSSSGPPRGRHPAESGSPGRLGPQWVFLHHLSVYCPGLPLSVLHPKLRAPPKEEVKSDQEENFSCQRRGDGAATPPVSTYSSFLAFSDRPALGLGPPAASVGPWWGSRRVTDAAHALVLPDRHQRRKVFEHKRQPAGGGVLWGLRHRGDSYLSFRSYRKLAFSRESLNLQQRKSIWFSPIALLPSEHLSHLQITFCFLIFTPPLPDRILSRGRGSCLFVSQFDHLHPQCPALPLTLWFSCFLEWMNEFFHIYLVCWPYMRIYILTA